MQREADIPIDIYYNKLLDWLIDRRHCNLKWQQSALDIRQKINDAIQDMPPNEEITKLLSGTHINYFHCKKITELLKQCGEGTTNFFGQYSSQRMKDWQEILQLYETDQVCLAEAANLLMRNVNYEIPPLKRQIGKAQQTQRDCTKKEGEYISNAAVFKEKYLQVCKEMGIKGEDIKTELLSLLNELPDIYNEVVLKTKKLEDAIDYYSAFVDFVVPNEEEKSWNQDVVPLLRFVLRNGNATVYQWRTGVIPTKIIEEKKQETSLVKNKNNVTEIDTIDFGDSETIDFGDSGQQIDFGETEENGDIDWGDGGIDFGDSNGGIDFGEGDVDINIEKTVEDSGIQVESSGKGRSEGDIAKGVDALSVFDNGPTRNMFVDELLELQVFLNQRVTEMSIEADILSANQFQSAPVVVQMQTKEKVEKLHSNVTSLLNSLTSMKIQNLYLLQSSPRYVDRLAESLRQRLKIAENMLHQAKKMVERRDIALELQRETEPTLSVIIKRTKELQQQISQEISKKYKDRIVNIMGEINTI